MFNFSKFIILTPLESSDREIRARISSPPSKTRQDGNGGRRNAGRDEEETGRRGSTSEKTCRYTKWFRNNGGVGHIQAYIPTISCRFARRRSGN